MRPRHCEHEEEILGAVRSGRLDDDLRDHAGACPVCADLLLVAAFMDAQGKEAAPGPLPDPDRIWTKAQTQARSATVERATWPIALTEQAACALGGAAGVALLLWRWPQIRDWLGGLGSLWSAAPQNLVLTPEQLLLLTLLVLPALVTLSILRTYRVEE
jgi:hypothetical protein